ncbi:hypothetical protein OAU50_03360 [Planctomycetota bacterium]|nr:hypothetical protein [Planctomycetota bacterium]
MKTLQASLLIVLLSGCWLAEPSAPGFEDALKEVSEVALEAVRKSEESENSKITAAGLADYAEHAEWPEFVFAKPGYFLDPMPSSA